MSHCRRREYQAFFCKILCRLVTPRHASAHANHHNISLDLLAAASRGTGASRRGQAARRSVRRVQMSLKAATSASRCVLGYRRSDVSSQRMAASGHGPPVSPTPAGGRFGSNLAADNPASPPTARSDWRLWGSSAHGQPSLVAPLRRADRYDRPNSNVT